MMITHLLDTSVYCQRLRPQPNPHVVARWSELGDAALAISAICEAELRFGLEKRQSPRLWNEFQHYLEHRLVLLPIDKQVADAFGALKAEMERKGSPRADFDLMIAATALAHGLILATLNPKHFAAIPELTLEDWSIPVVDA